MTSKANIRAAIIEAADLLVSNARADGIEEHEIEGHATDKRIAAVVAGLHEACAPSITPVVTRTFCADVRDRISMMVG